MRFLYDQERYEELDKSLEFIYAKNGQDLYDDENDRIGAKQYIALGDKLKKNTKVHPLAQIRDEQHSFANLVCLVVVWISVTFSYYVVST